MSQSNPDPSDPQPPGEPTGTPEIVFLSPVTERPPTIPLPASPPVPEMPQQWPRPQPGFLLAVGLLVLFFLIQVIFGLFRLKRARA